EGGDAPPRHAHGNALQGLLGAVVQIQILDLDADVLLFDVPVHAGLSEGFHTDGMGRHGSIVHGRVSRVRPWAGYLRPENRICHGTTRKNADKLISFIPRVLSPAR